MLLPVTILLLFVNSFFVIMLTSSPPSSHINSPDMVHVSHVSEAAEWLDGAVVGRGKQEDRREGR